MHLFRTFRKSPGGDRTGFATRNSRRTYNLNIQWEDLSAREDSASKSFHEYYALYKYMKRWLIEIVANIAHINTNTFETLDSYRVEIARVCTGRQQTERSLKITSTNTCMQLLQSQKLEFTTKYWRKNRGFQILIEGYSEEKVKIELANFKSTK